MHIIEHKICPDFSRTSRTFFVIVVTLNIFKLTEIGNFSFDSGKTIHARENNQAVYPEVYLTYYKY